MLQSLAPDLWVTPHDVFLPGGVHFPARMTTVRLPSGALALISPVPIDDALAAQLDALGPVAFLVAPNRFHHLYLGPARDRYPQARVLAAPGLAEKRRDLDLREVLADTAPAEWGGALLPVLVAGMPAVNEVALLHAPSRTLVLTDLVFNLHRWKGWQTGLLLRLIGCHKRLALSRSERLLVRDRPAAGASARRILALDFDRLVMAHGEVVETGAHAALAQAWRPLLGAAPALAVAS